jgi:heme exporter protein D
MPAEEPDRRSIPAVESGLAVLFGKATRVLWLGVAVVLLVMAVMLVKSIIDVKRLTYVRNNAAVRPGSEARRSSR